MRIDITPGRGRVSVGPPGGPAETIPASVTVTITDTVPYDVEARLEWSPTVGKLAVRRVCCTALPGGDDVSPAGIARIALRDTVQTALETEYLGSTGWPGLLAKHGDHDSLSVDALIYLLAVAFQSPKPTATVALARGLSPATGPKRVLAARKAGLLPETEPGKPAGA
jgi:hypothetical protein